MDLLFKKGGSSAPREPPWLLACIRMVGWDCGSQEKHMLA